MVHFQHEKGRRACCVANLENKNNCKVIQCIFSFNRTIGSKDLEKLLRIWEIQIMNR